MQHLFSDSECKSADLKSQKEYRIPSLSLMEEAAFLAFGILKKYITATSRILIIAGSGNNGGDGLALARILYANGFKNIKIYSFGGKETEERRIQREACEALKLEFTDKIEYCDVIVDALYGIGLKGKLREDGQSVIDRINSLKTFVLSLDVPSGLGDEAYNTAVQADVLVCFGRIKQSLFALGNRKYFKVLKLVNPGFPAEVFPPHSSIALVSEKDYEPLKLKIDDFKGTRGRLAIIGGSKEYSGAVRLSAKAAFAAGCGMITVFTHPDLVSTVALDCDASVMVRPYDDFPSLAETFDAVLAGPGLGKEWERSLEMVSKENLKTLVLDADAARGYKNTAQANRIIITPHIGEFKGLCQKTSFDSPNDFYETLKKTAKANRATIVLKTELIHICDGDEIKIVEGLNPSIGVAGSGDVLSGLVAALAARGNDDVAQAVLLHQMAGRRLHEKDGYYSADDLIKEVGRLR